MLDPAAAIAAAAAGASKFYAEAMKQGTAESLLSLAGSSSDAEATVQLTALLGNIDEKVRSCQGAVCCHTCAVSCASDAPVQLTALLGNIGENARSCRGNCLLPFFTLHKCLPVAPALRHPSPDSCCTARLRW